MFSWIPRLLSRSSQRLHAPVSSTPPRTFTSPPCHTIAPQAAGIAAQPIQARASGSPTSDPARRAPSTRIIEWESTPSGNTRTLARVVMVGRFAEICAELDRLAALEAA